jgi:hypothetical protein
MPGAAYPAAIATDTTFPSEDTSNESHVRLLDHRVSGYLSRLSSFLLSPIVAGNGDKDSSKGEGEDRSLDSLNDSRIFHTSDVDLPGGQLTSRGFMQHILLGVYLRKAYERFLGAVESPAELYVRSTNYDRTVQVVQPPP